MQISIFVLGFAAACACVPALAQDLTAGKTPAQLFRSDCAECHRSPSAVASNRDVGTLTDFLREHYTTKPETAGALAAYVSGFAASSGRRNRGEAEAAANGGDARSKAKLIEDPAGRHRRTASPPGDGEKRAADEEEDVRRPPRAIRTAPASSKSNVRTRDGATRDVTEPFSRLRAYLQSAPGAENEVGEAGKAAAPKVRKRRNRANAGPPAPDVEPKD
jgi:hypothetical protein